jgi:hypothetical protein
VANALWTITRISKSQMHCWRNDLELYAWLALRPDAWQLSAV